MGTPRCAESAPSSIYKSICPVGICPPARNNAMLWKPEHVVCEQDKGPAEPSMPWPRRPHTYRYVGSSRSLPVAGHRCSSCIQHLKHPKPSNNTARTADLPMRDSPPGPEPHLGPGPGPEPPQPSCTKRLAAAIRMRGRTSRLDTDMRRPHTQQLQQHAPYVAMPIHALLLLLLACLPVHALLCVPPLRARHHLPLASHVPRRERRVF